MTLVLSPVNRGTVHPMNVIWSTARTPFVAKVDNDTLIPEDLLARLARLLSTEPDLGVISGCHFRPEDSPEVHSDDPGDSILQRPHVGGCAVMMRRQVFHDLGLIPCNRLWADGPYLETGWTDYQHRLDRAGFINGYPLPLMFVDHMEDTRSEHSITSAEHEQYKAAMRGSSLEEATRKYYVTGARRLREHGEVRRLDSPVADAEQITLFIPMSGRMHLWPRLEVLLDEQAWPHAQISLVLLDASGDADFHAAICRWVQQCDYSDVRILQQALGTPGLADLPRESVTPAVRAVMAEIYRRLQSLVQTEFIWILEDDVLPPVDVLIA